MTTTDAPVDVASLRPGDVVELSWTERGATVTVRGPLYDTGRSLHVGELWIRDELGRNPWPDRTLRLVSRAAPPLYRNHPRTEPVAGDMVRDGEGRVVGYTGQHWYRPGYITQFDTADLPRPLTLLVDGETRRSVPEDGAR